MPIVTILSRITRIERKCEEKEINRSQQQAYLFPFDIVQSIETFVEMPSQSIDRYWKSEKYI